MKSTTQTLDKVAIGLSLACAIHCLVLPLMLVMLPALAGSVFLDESVHRWMLAIVLPTSLAALTMGCRQHRNITILIVGLLGLTLMVLAVILGHNVLGETGEKLTSVIGASLIAVAHIRNYTLCKHTSCES